MPRDVRSPQEIRCCTSPRRRRRASADRESLRPASMAHDKHDKRLLRLRRPPCIHLSHPAPRQFRPTNGCTPGPCSARPPGHRTPPPCPTSTKRRQRPIEEASAGERRLCVPPALQTRNAAQHHSAPAADDANRRSSSFITKTEATANDKRVIVCILACFCSWGSMTALG